MGDAPGKSRLKVFVRLRPLADDQKKKQMSDLVTSERQYVCLKDPAGQRANEFYFDRILDDKVKQEEVFSEVGKPLIQHVFSGYNACCFAYGQTGSGKTYSMFGEETGDWNKRGVIPLTVENIFSESVQMQKDKGVQVKVFVSFLEIYLDHIRDLGGAYQAQIASGQLSAKGSPRSTSARGGPPGSGRQPTPKGMAGRPPSGRDELEYDIASQSLELQEDPNGSLYVKDLTHLEVQTIEEVMSIVKAGVALRQTAGTSINEVSSRSHTVFTLTVVQQRPGQNGDENTVSGRLNLVDLAGSERLKKSESEGQRLKEMKIINTSLSALGKVVLALASGDAGHVPYRDSKLTRVLKESLGGNSYTALLATLNPDPENYEESMNTLQFAHRCTNVQTMPRINYVASDQMGAEVKLRSEITKLKNELEAVHTHYQKVIESLGGTLGPFEGTERSTLTATGSNEILSSEPAGPGSVGMSSVNQRRMPALKEGAVSEHVRAMVRDMENEVKVLENKVEEKNQQVRAVQERLIKAESQHASEAKASKQKIAHLSQTVQDDKMFFANELDERDRDHQETMTSLQDQNLEMKKQLAEMAYVIPQQLESRLKRERKDRDLEDTIREEMKIHQQRELAKLRRQNARHIANLKEQGEYFLNQRTDELKSYIAEHERFKVQKEAELAEAKEEGNYLAQYTEKLAVIVDKLMWGQYAIKDRNGMRQFVVSSKDKPKALDKSKCQLYSQKLNEADAILSRLVPTKPSILQDISRPNTAPTGVGRVNRMGTPPLPGFRKSETPKVVESKQTMVHPPTEVNLDVMSMGEDELRAELMRMRALGQTSTSMERNLFETQVLDELAAHPTVEYIKTLEDDVKRYQKALQDERKKGVEMRVALESFRRVEQTYSKGGVGARTKSAGSARSAASAYELHGQKYYDPPK